MANTALGTILRHIRLTALERQSDAELLDAVALEHNDAAFAALVRRHGGLVLRVCRHVLGHEQDAEDVFQATFVALAMKAASIRNAGALPSFLHGVAYRLALKAKRDLARRRKHEAKAVVRSAAEAPDLGWREVQAVLEEEIERLPEKYRAPFLLCYFEGLSRAEAARQLSLKEGTVWSRLAKARAQLQERLAQRGIALTAVLGALAVAEVGRAAVPARWFTAAVRTAQLLAAGKTPSQVVSTSVAALAQTGLHTLTVSKMKMGLAALAAWLMVTSTAGIGLLLTAPPPERAAAAQPAANSAEAPGTEEDSGLGGRHADSARPHHAALMGDGHRQRTVERQPGPRRSARRCCPRVHGGLPDSSLGRPAGRPTPPGRDDGKGAAPLGRQPAALHLAFDLRAGRPTVCGLWQNV